MDTKDVRVRYDQKEEDLRRVPTSSCVTGVEKFLKVVVTTSSQIINRGLRRSFGWS